MSKILLCIHQPFISENPSVWNKEVHVREWISNASDALEKSMLAVTEELSIKIKENHVLGITDTLVLV